MVDGRGRSIANAQQEVRLPEDGNVSDQWKAEESRDTNDRYLIHIAAEEKLSLYGCMRLIKKNVMALSEPDPCSGMLPFMLAAQSDTPNSNLSTVYYMLHEKPDVLSNY